MIISYLQNKNDGMFHVTQLRVLEIFKEDGRNTKFSKGPRTFSFGIISQEKTLYFDFHTGTYRDKVMEDLKTRPYLNSTVLHEPLIEDDIAMGMLELMVTDKTYLGKNILIRAARYAGVDIHKLDLFRYHRGKIQFDFPYLTRVAPEPEKFIRDCACTLLMPTTLKQRHITPLQFYKYMTR